MYIDERKSGMINMLKKNIKDIRQKSEVCLLLPHYFK